nr:hypothetical protein Iba_chr08eCG1370 [Ipomoea batatas]
MEKQSAGFQSDFCCCWSSPLGTVKVFPPSNCYNEEQREVYRVEQPPERGINDTAGAWVSTWSRRISVVDGVSHWTAQPLTPSGSPKFLRRSRLRTRILRCCSRSPEVAVFFTICRRTCRAKKKEQILGWSSLSSDCIA